MSDLKDKQPKEFAVSRRQRPKMTGTKGGQRALSSNFLARTSTPATLVYETTPTSPEYASSKFENGLELADTFKIRSRPVSETKSSPISPASVQLPVRKRVVFAEPLYTPPSSIRENEMNPADPRSINEDFDFSERDSIYKTTRFSGIQRKLVKKKSFILHRRSSSSNMAQTTEAPERTSSISSNRSIHISQRLDSIFGSNIPRTPTSPTSQQPSPTTTTHSTTTSIAQPATGNPLPNTPLTSLPDDRTVLEALINIHLSKLDRYRRQIASFNATISTLVDDLHSLINTPLAQTVPQLVTALELETEETRAGRDSKRRYVDFHRGELRVIAEKRLLLDEEMGVPPSLPGVFDGLDGEEIWEERFW